MSLIIMLLALFIIIFYTRLVQKNVKLKKSSIALVTVFFVILFASPIVYHTVSKAQPTIYTKEQLNTHFEKVQTFQRDLVDYNTEHYKHLIVRTETLEAPETDLTIRIKNTQGMRINYFLEKVENTNQITVTLYRFAPFIMNAVDVTKKIKAPQAMYKNDELILEASSVNKEMKVAITGPFNDLTKEKNILLTDAGPKESLHYESPYYYYIQVPATLKVWDKDELQIRKVGK